MADVRIELVNRWEQITVLSKYPYLQEDLVEDFSCGARGRNKVLENSYIYRCIVAVLTFFETRFQQLSTTLRYLRALNVY